MEYIRIIQPPKSKVMKSGRVILKPGEDVGEHITEKREEIIIVLKGKATIKKSGKDFVVEQGNTFYIEEGITHNIFNKTEFVLEYIFVVSLFE